MELLTADDVLKKTFTTTKFRDGYDIEEVDDFLDLVLGTLRELNSENERLAAAADSADQSAGHDNAGELAEAKAQWEAEAVSLRDQLAAAETRAAEAELRANASSDELGNHQQQLDEVRAQAAAAAQQADALRSELEQVRNSAPAAAPAAEPDAATGIIQLAQQLHDDHVRQGQDEAARLVSEANDERSRIISEAEDKSAQILANLEQQRSALEGKIEDLKNFERDYRSRLESSLKSMLHDLGTGPNGAN